MPPKRAIHLYNLTKLTTPLTLWIMLGFSIFKVLRNAGWGNGSVSKHAGSQAWRTEFKHSEPRLVHTHASKVEGHQDLQANSLPPCSVTPCLEGIGQSVEWDTWRHPLSPTHVQTGMCAHTPIHDVHIQHTYIQNLNTWMKKDYMFVGWLLMHNSMNA